MSRALPLLVAIGLLTPVACERARATTPADAAPKPTSVETEQAAAPVDDATEPEPEPETEPEPEPPSESEPDRQALATAVREQLPTLTSCYEDQLQHDRSLRGKLRVTITIEADGWVSNAIIDEDGVGSEAVRACVVERMRTWGFIEVELHEATELGFAVDFEPDSR